MINKERKMEEKIEYVYIYKMNGEEFITGSYDLARFRNQSDEIFILDSNGVKYLIDDEC